VIVALPCIARQTLIQIQSRNFSSTTMSATHDGGSDFLYRAPRRSSRDGAVAAHHPGDLVGETAVRKPNIPRWTSLQKCHVKPRIGRGRARVPTVYPPAKENILTRWVLYLNKYYSPSPPPTHRIQFQKAIDNLVQSEANPFTVELAVNHECTVVVSDKREPPR